MEKLNKEYIKLDQFLKMSNIISTGGEAKIYLMENKVLVNGIEENRRGRKLYPGDTVTVKGRKLVVGWSFRM